MTKRDNEAQRNRANQRRHANKHANKRSGNWVKWIVLLSILLVLPVLAIRKLILIHGVMYILGYLAVVSLITLALYRSDKRAAQSGGWRTPEGTLHFWELVGGWPAAFLAQRIFWHKISKQQYQVLFWLIGFLHQYLAFDFLSGWQYSPEIYAFFQRMME